MLSSSVKVVSGGRGAEFFPSPLAPASTLSQAAYIVSWEVGEQAEHGGKCPYLVTRKPGFCPLYLGEVPFPEPLLENGEVKTEEQECGVNMGKKRKKVCDHVGYDVFEIRCLKRIDQNLKRKKRKTPVYSRKERSSNILPAFSSGITAGPT